MLCYAMLCYVLSFELSFCLLSFNRKINNRDPTQAFFVHRIGRTARAGRQGSALVFVSAEEKAYVEFLLGRGVPLQEIDKATLCNDGGLVQGLGQRLGEEETAPGNLSIHDEMKRLSMGDRALLEASSTAFMSFLRAYKEHQCAYIFRFDRLDIGAVARCYALLKLPVIKETRGRRKDIQFEATVCVETRTLRSFACLLAHPCLYLSYHS